MLKNPWIAFVIVLVLAMIEVELLGMMKLWDVKLNAISVVNLVMAIGVCLQHFVHLAFVYNTNDGARYFISV